MSVLRFKLKKVLHGLDGALGGGAPTVMTRATTNEVESSGAVAKQETNKSQSGDSKTRKGGRKIDLS
ncbi:hypothetical protein CRG98_042490 [Punica granatum]|uniref:Uncharacterized protein n=1 Tax=Punica granatum TaxID=22663 RepID=A0A2I0HZL2_PUNGR|nr:hypothetical protein CRG98_042490 [Punica granatum]